MIKWPWKLVRRSWIKQITDERDALARDVSLQVAKRTEAEMGWHEAEHHLAYLRGVMGKTIRNSDLDPLTPPVMQVKAGHYYDHARLADVISVAIRPKEFALFYQFQRDSAELLGINAEAAADKLTHGWFEDLKGQIKEELRKIWQARVTATAR